MRRLAMIPAVFLGLCLWLAPVAPVIGAPKPLQIYFIDVEGGQSTLIVDPQGESLLIDTGWDDFNGRDANRIMIAAKSAGIDHIDDVLITHYHTDHAGGVPQLASQIKIGTFFDHGPNTEMTTETRATYAAYEKVAAQAKRVTVKPGDEILAINGQSTSNLILPDVREAIRREAVGDKLTLLLESGGKQRTVVVTLKDLV